MFDFERLEVSGSVAPRLPVTLGASGLAAGDLFRLSRFRSMGLSDAARRAPDGRVTPRAASSAARFWAISAAVAGFALPAWEEGVVNPETLDPSGCSHASEPEPRTEGFVSLFSARSAAARGPPASPPGVARRCAPAVSILTNFLSTPRADTVEVSACLFPRLRSISIILRLSFAFLDALGSLSSSEVRDGLLMGESRLRGPATGTAGAPMVNPLMRVLDGIGSSADNDRLRLSRDWALRLIGDKPDGEIAIAG